ncbi:hypothetical protein [Sorangium cellulosum]|uniref:VIT domain-containing protein n=1 Tax=Sorangium cellulosum So0157-2 TaxID=1254432 RepID=S4XSD3_SORCE|nr:hypothetical protein [Sorangium cellulosum]AGP35419.1 hypothetical protein SCE1572_13325 [Sorangium cellulosum So0157-2]
MSTVRPRPRSRRPAVRPAPAAAPAASPRLAGAVLAGAALLLAAAGARAGGRDSVEGTETNALVEKEHRIALRLDRGHAELVVQRTIHNGGPRRDQALFLLNVPQGAVATGLASLGLKGGRPFWRRADLMEAEAAAIRYMELPGVEGSSPTGAALLSWRSHGFLALQASPCPPGQPRTVEYTLRMPTAYFEGRHHLTLPRVGTETLAATVVVSAARPGDRLFLDGKPISPGATFRLAQDETDLALAPRPSLALDGAFSSSPLGSGRELVALRIDAPLRLSEPPRDARVVVLLDASRSLPERDGAAALAAARAYLSHLDGSLVEVLTFDREVRPRHGRFVPAARAAADLGTLVLPRRNGSRLDDALARADALLAATPAGLPRRILALTDLRTRSALTPRRLGAILKSGALVHVGVIGEGAPGLTRNEHPVAAPVRATGGLVWTARASARPGDAGAMRRVYEEWVRPLRIDRLDVRLPGTGLSKVGFGEQLTEGDGLALLRLHGGRVARAELTGELWARPVRRVFAPDPAHARLWSALVFGSELLESLTEREMAVLAFRGGAVSPVTSYVASAPGKRPRTVSLGGGTGRGASSHEGLGRGLGHGGPTGSGSAFDHRAYLRAALQKAFGGCPAGPRSARVTLETTVDEVVDVPAVRLAGRHAAAVRRCLGEAAWSLVLPGEFIEQLASYEIEISR